jgi:hypothetical protein
MVFVMFWMGIFTPGLATAQQFNALWMKRSVSQSVSVTVPGEQWTAMLKVKKADAGQLSSYQYRNGDRWMTLQREDAALVSGLSAKQMSTLMRLPRRDAVMVFARYVPQQSQLVINAIKVEEGRDGYMYVYQTYYSPYHGDLYAASRAFLTADEKTDVSRAGRNPFASFEAGDRTNPTFMNIGWDGAMVVVGQAMKHFHAAYSVMSVQNLRMSQSVTTSGGFLHKTTTIKVDGYADPSWFIGLPTTMQTWGNTAAICATATTTSTNPTTGVIQGAGCPDPNLVVFSGVSFDEWKGNTMPGTEEHIYHWEQSKSGFTVLFFTVLVMAAAFFAGPELFSAAAASESGGEAAVAEAEAISGEASAGYAGAAYAGGSLATTSGPASLTSIKDGAFGTVGDGTQLATASSSQQVQAATAILVQRQLQTRFDSTGTCSDSGTLCSTQAIMSLATPDPSAVIFGGDQRTLRARQDYCIGLGLQNVALTQCIVPPDAPIDVP